MEAMQGRMRACGVMEVLIDGTGRMIVRHRTARSETRKGHITDRVHEFPSVELNGTNGLHVLTGRQSRDNIVDPTGTTHLASRREFRHNRVGCGRFGSTGCCGKTLVTRRSNN